MVHLSEDKIRRIASRALNVLIGFRKRATKAETQIALIRRTGRPTRATRRSSPTRTTDLEKIQRAGKTS